MLPTLRILLLVLAVPAAAEAQSPPRMLTALAAKARLSRPVVRWCTGEFRTGQPGAFAVALAPDAGSGRYLILAADATVMELARFTGNADLACYSRAEAEALSISIAGSETVQGRVTPRFDTTVACGFVDNTEAVCWQYSPTDHAFVRVGGWIT